jgi:hypothetical protein
MQRDAAVRRVHRLAARPRLGVDGATGVDEGGHIRDRIVQDAAGRRPLQVQRLIEVGRSLGVDGEELDVPRIVQIGRWRDGDRLGRLLRLGLDPGRERRELLLQLRQRVDEGIPGGFGDQPRAVSGHPLSVGTRSAPGADSASLTASELPHPHP